MKAFKTLWLAGLVLSVGVTFAKGPAKATVQVTSEKDKLVFKTIPNEGLVINHEGPWSLKITSLKGVKSTVTELKRSDWKENSATFELPVTSEKSAKSAEVQFKATVFVCTKEKTQCYREVIEDKATVKL